jgi:hypothetical protein
MGFVGRPGCNPVAFSLLLASCSRWLGLQCLALADICLASQWQETNDAEHMLLHDLLQIDRRLLEERDKEYGVDAGECGGGGGGKPVCQGSSLQVSLIPERTSRLGLCLKQSSAEAKP